MAEILSSEKAVILVKKDAPKAINSLNAFAKEGLRTRGGRLGSGMGSLLEALWVYFANQALHNEGGIAADCEIAWLPDHEPNDFACVHRDAAWKSTTREGELFRIEAKSMNVDVDESKGHFTELITAISSYDQILILVWRWLPLDEWRVTPQIIDYLLCPAKPVAQLRDLLHVARGGSFVTGGQCSDKCKENPCSHTGEPLNAAGKRERKGGPENTRPSSKVAFANNFGGLVRMIKTDNENARKIFRKERKSNQTAHEYISFIHKNFPKEELNQYTLSEWRIVGSQAGIKTTGKSAAQIAQELRELTPNYQDLMRNMLSAD